MSFQKKRQTCSGSGKALYQTSTTKVLVRTIEETRDDYAFKGEDFGLTASWGSMHALMGNIAYKIPDELDDFNTKGYLKFDLGELAGS